VRHLLLLATAGVTIAPVPRFSPLVYVTIDNKMLIVGSFDDNNVAPGWAHNQLADPRTPTKWGRQSRHCGREPSRNASYRKVVAACLIS
jgi:hypothetical protein